MKPGFFSIGLCLIPLAAATAAAAPVATPFANNNGALPPSSQYSGPLFKLSHAYPAKVTAPAMPWRDAIQNGQITVQNASVYAEALKAWRGKAQGSVDNAQMRYFVVHFHRLMEPDIH